MRQIILVLFILLLISSCISQQEDKQVYTADWESLAGHEAAPEWLADAKLGIYFHWGVFSVPAYFSEWYPWYMYRSDDNHIARHHRESWGDPAAFNYHDFVPLFTGEHFDAEEWASLFKAAGARFAGPSAVHSDGFAMWDSEVNPWNAKDRGPKVDVTGELLSALEKEGMKTITTFHHARNMQRNADNPEEWEGYTSHYAYHPDYATSSTDPDTAKLYGNLPGDEFHQYWYDQVMEVVDQYSPDIMWFDSWLNLIPENYLKDFAANYLNEAGKQGQEVAIISKQYDFPGNMSVLDIEQGGKKDLSETLWMTDVTLGLESWCYTEGLEYKTADLVLRNMIDVWSKNGIVLLNLSPTKEGIIPDGQRKVLMKLGRWLDKYGEAVYGTRPYQVYGFGSASESDGHFGGQSAVNLYTSNDIRFTRSKDKKSVYVFFLGRPDPGKTVGLRILGPHRYPLYSPLKKVTILGTDTEVEWKMDSDNVWITIPNAPMDELATVIKLELMQ